MMSEGHALLASMANLKEIRIIGAQYGTLLRSANDAEAIAVVSERSQPECRIDASELVVVISLALLIRAADEIEAVEVSPQEDSEDLAWVRATFELSYQVPEGAVIGGGDLASFADGTVLFNAWPYWREFIQSSLQRMGLPPITVPLLRRQPAPPAIAAKDAHRKNKKSPDFLSS